MSTQTGKDTIYIDVDDEITTIIDKLRGSEHRIVALVLPKRATVLQSIVNMKLLKRTADSSKKQLVLITSEHSLMPLAGAVGLYVAKTLQSKPEVPMAPAGERDHDAEETVNMNDASDDEPVDKSRPIGDLAGGAGAAGAAGALAGAAEDEEPIELDNADMDAAATEAKKKQPKAKKNKALKIPDFNKFRMWLALGALGLVVIIFVGWLMLSAMPRATIVVKTDSQAIQTSQDVILSTSANSVDPASNSVPAQSVQTQKTQMQQVATTGQQNNGQKASGTIYFYDCSVQDLLFGNQAVVPAGTAVVANGLTFITTQAVSVPPSNFNGDQSCKKNAKSQSVGIVAQGAGAKYNIPSQSYSVPSNSNVTGVGSDTTGGTDQIVKIVTQADIDGAKQKITAQDTSSIKDQLRQQLQGQSLMAVDVTLNAGSPDITTSANAGDQADNVTVTEKITYTMLGAKESDLQTLVATAVDKQIDTSKQKILDYGISSATFQLKNQQNGSATVGMSDTAVAGSDLNIAQLKQQVAGKKPADAKSVISSNPGVTNVTVNLSPFWVSSIPGKTSKITITVEKPAVKHAQ